MKKYFKAQKGRRAGLHPYTDEDIKRVNWCIEKNIRIAVVPKWDGVPGDWQVEISINGKTHADPKVYSGYDAQTKMYEYYKYYYDKNIQESK
jgi:hypothetical protein